MIIQERKGKERKRQQKICVVYNLTFRFLSYRKTQQKWIHCFWRKHILLQGNHCNFLLDPVVWKTLVYTNVGRISILKDVNSQN